MRCGSDSEWVEGGWNQKRENRNEGRDRAGFPKLFQAGAPLASRIDC